MKGTDFRTNCCSFDDSTRSCPVCRFHLIKSHAPFTGSTETTAARSRSSSLASPQSPAAGIRRRGRVRRILLPLAPAAGGGQHALPARSLRHPDKQATPTNHDRALQHLRPHKPELARRFDIVQLARFVSSAHPARNRRQLNTFLRSQAMELTAVLTPAEEGGYLALNPETGTTTQGETVEEAIANLQEATGLYLSEFPLPALGHPLVTTFSVPAHA